MNCVKEIRNKTAPLEPYIHQAQYDAKRPPRGKIFSPLQHNDVPKLEQGRIHRIIVYPGYFNPPHKVHEAMAVHSFYYCGRDYNAVALVFLPFDIKPATSDFLATEFGDGAKAISFTTAEKEKLFYGVDAIPCEFAWIFGDTPERWPSFMERLTKLINADGFELTWVCLCAPSQVYRSSGICPIPSYCTETLICDISRTADFVQPYSQDHALVIKLKGCGDWIASVPDYALLKKHAQWRTADYLQYAARQGLREKEELEDPKFAKEIAGDFLRLSMLEKMYVRICYRLHGPKEQIRFISTASEKKEPFVGISTRNIQRLLAKYQLGIMSRQLVLDGLEHYTYYPALLLKIVDSKITKSDKKLSISKVAQKKHGDAQSESSDDSQSTDDGESTDGSEYSEN